MPERRLGWQPSQFLSTRAGAERAFQFAERLGSERHGRDALVSWVVLSKGDFVTEPRDLTDLVPADVRTEPQELLGVKVVRSELTYLLVRLDKEYTKRRPAERWEDYYARELVRQFGPSWGLISGMPSAVP